MQIKQFAKNIFCIKLKKSKAIPATGLGGYGRDL
jgi:hypothetical protein